MLTDIEIKLLGIDTWKMRLVLGAILLCSGLSVVSGCTNARVKTYSCLTAFFKQTNQTMPQGLERILQQAGRKESGRTRRDVTPARTTQEMEAPTKDYGTVQDGGGRKTAAFGDHWCGPFSKYVTCMEYARTHCESGGMYFCSMMTTFSLMYGTDICDVNIQPWIAKDIPSCKDSGAASLLCCPVLWGLQLILMWTLIASR